MRRRRTSSSTGRPASTAGSRRSTPAGTGKKRVAVTASLGGLAPATRYHYRLVAKNSKGRVFGGDRTFKTKPQPLGVTLAATPNPVGYGKATTLAGNLTGTGNAGRQIVLQMNPFPYTQGFQNLGNPQVTDAAGGFSFPILSATLNAQFRVLMPAEARGRQPDRGARRGGAGQHARRPPPGRCAASGSASPASSGPLATGR